MYNRIVFGGSLSQFFSVNIPDLNKREYTILGTLVAFTLFFGIFPSVILNGLHYSVSTLIYSYNSEIFAILPSLSATSISGLSNIKPNPYFITGFADASTKYLVVEIPLFHLLSVIAINNLHQFFRGIGDWPKEEFYLQYSQYLLLLCWMNWKNMRLNTFFMLTMDYFTQKKPLTSLL
jgi:hypothetical protein